MESATSPIHFNQFIRLVIDAVVAANVDYLIGGAVATWVWGLPRSTLDFDVVINLPVEQIYPLSQELQKRDMLVPFEIIVDLLIEDRGDLPINAIHLHSGYKAELFLLRPGDELRATALQRRRSVDFGEPIGPVYVHAPEDLILYKLKYFQLSRQTKHVRDIQSILLTMGDELDRDYLTRWIEKLGLQPIWQEMQA